MLKINMGYEPPINSDLLPAHRTHAAVVALMVSFSVVNYFDRIIMSIASPHIIEEFGLSETRMGVIFTGFYVTYTLFMIPGGRWADRFGPRAVLTAMMLSSAVFTGLTALGGRPGLGVLVGVVPGFLVLRLCFGTATAPLYPACARMISNWVPIRQRGRAWGWVASGAGLGGAIVPIVFSWAIGRYGWRLSFCFAGTVTFLLGIVWLVYARDYPSEHPSVGPKAALRLSPTADPPRFSRPPVTQWWSLLGNRNLMLLTTGYFTVAYFDYIFFNWIYYYFDKIRHLGPHQSAIDATPIFLTWLIMTPLGGWVSDRLVMRYGREAGRRLVPICGLSLAALLLYLGATFSNMIATITVMSLALGLAASTESSFWASAIDLAGRDVGAAGGILNTGGNVGGIVAPVLTPLIASVAGWSWGLYSGCLILMAGILIWFFLEPSPMIPSR